jgi:uncharacterized protein Yka (UPF0111/DUF47 family)
MMDIEMLRVIVQELRARAAKLREEAGAWSEDMQNMEAKAEASPAFREEYLESARVSKIFANAGKAHAEELSELAELIESAMNGFAGKALCTAIESAARAR